MKQPDLKYWASIQDWMSDHSKYPSVSLLTDHVQGISCTLKPDGMMELSTSSGGGHGDPRTDSKGMSYDDWINLINEAKAVAEHYWCPRQARRKRNYEAVLDIEANAHGVTTGEKEQ